MARKTAILKAFARVQKPFEQVPITDDMIRDYPLLMNCRAIYANSRVEVHMYALETSIGGVMQVTMVRHGNLEPLTWEEIQRSLHEIFGPEVVAVEIYPSLQNQWETNNGLRVLWVLPGVYELPFGLEKPGAWGKPA